MNDLAQIMKNQPLKLSSGHLDTKTFQEPKSTSKSDRRAPPTESFATPSWGPKSTKTAPKSNQKGYYSCIDLQNDFWSDLEPNLTPT